MQAAHRLAHKPDAHFQPQHRGGSFRSAAAAPRPHLLPVMLRGALEGGAAAARRRPAAAARAARYSRILPGSAPGSCRRSRRTPPPARGRSRGASRQSRPRGVSAQRGGDGTVSRGARSRSPGPKPPTRRAPAALPMAPAQLALGAPRRAPAGHLTGRTLPPRRSPRRRPPAPQRGHRPGTAAAPGA